MKAVSLPLVKPPLSFLLRFIFVVALSFAPAAVFAQESSAAASESLITMPGIIITITLLIIPLVAALLLVVVKANSLFKSIKSRKDTEEAKRFSEYLKTLNVEQLDALQKHKEHQDYHLNNRELAGPFSPEDNRGLLSSISERANIRFI